MAAGSLSRRYAKALLSIGVESQTYDAIGKEVDRMASTISGSPELRAALGNPSISGERRRGIVEELVKRLALSKPVRSFVLLLLEKGRLEHLPDIARAYQGLVDEHANRVRATVTSAKPIDPATAERIQKALEKQTGKTVVLEQKQDPTLLGGMTTQLGDTVYDGSVRTQLEQLRASLLN